MPVRVGMLVHVGVSVRVHTRRAHTHISYKIIDAHHTGYPVDQLISCEML